MIDKVIVRHFKRFKEEVFEINSNTIVLAGQNNIGKTTVMQAVALWHFSLEQWLNSSNQKTSNRKERAIGLLRKEFAPVPVREFNQLWTDKSTGFKRGGGKMIKKSRKEHRVR